MYTSSIFNTVFRQHPEQKTISFCCTPITRCFHQRYLSVRLYADETYLSGARAARKCWYYNITSTDENSARSYRVVRIAIVGFPNVVSDRFGRFQFAFGVCCLAERIRVWSPTPEKTTPFVIFGPHTDGPVSVLPQQTRHRLFEPLTTHRDYSGLDENRRALATRTRP